MKKFLYIVFTFLLTFTFIGVEAKTIYLQECEYTEEYKKWLSLSDKEKKNSIMPPVCKNESKNKFNVVGNSNKVFDDVSISDSSFDLRDYGYVTNVKDQGETGACWAFSTNASIESNLLVNGKGTYDLSEAHLEFSTQNTVKYNRITFNRKINSGGNYFMSSAYLRNNWGPVLESTLPFSELDNYLKNGVKVNEEKILNNKAMLNVNSIAMLANETCTDDAIKDIKEYLITNGAISAMTYYGSTSSFNLYQYYNGESYVDLNGNTVSANEGANHAITIVGWDDTISKDKFLSKTKPSEDGAFIIKNSYGEYFDYEINLSQYRQALYNNDKEKYNNLGINSYQDITDEMIIEDFGKRNGIEPSQLKVMEESIRIYVGDNGYQYISYEDIHICNLAVGFFDVDTNTSDNVYGYDELGFSKNLTNMISDSVYLASVFDKKTENDEKLTSVNVYFAKINQKYDVYFANGDTKQLSKMKLIATGTSKFEGYHTIKIDDELITEDKYSIVVKITSEDEMVFGVSMDRLDANFWNDIEIRQGVQYLSSDGINYSDVQNEINVGKFHLLVKAYTNNVVGDDNNDDITPPNEGENNNNENNPEDDNPEDDNKEEDKPNGDVVLPPSDDNKDDDETNDDNKIEILPNEMNNNNNNNNDSNEPNANTGDNGIYILIGISTILIVSGISYRKMKMAK